MTTQPHGSPRLLTAALLLLLPVTSTVLFGCGDGDDDRPVVRFIEGDSTVIVETSDCCCCCDGNAQDCDSGEPAPSDDACADLDTPTPYEFDLDSACSGPATPVDVDFAPQVEWEWAPTDARHIYNQVIMTPVAGNLTDDTGDGLIDDNDIPDVVFIAYQDPNYFDHIGALVIVSGDDGSETYYQSAVVVPDGSVEYPSSRGGVALGDIDADGTPEACFVAYSGRVVCVQADGTVVMATSVPTSHSREVFARGYPSIGDIDSDGKAEVTLGNVVWRNDGTLLFEGAADFGGYAPMSFITDIDGSGQQVLVAGSTVYSATGSIIHNLGYDGFSAIADLDLDGEAEVLSVSPNGVLSIHEADGSGTVLVNLDHCTNNYLCGPPTVADFDGDGYPEIGIAGDLAFNVYDYTDTDTDGVADSWTVLWSNITNDGSGGTGASVFDFEDDGIAEVVFGDEDTFFIWRGTNGSNQLSGAGLDPTDHSNGTVNEMPILLDVDRDDSTEIILASNALYTPDGWFGVRSIGSGSGDSWAPSRAVWNQHAYSISHINNDLSVPQFPVPSWLDHNSFRAAHQGSIDSTPGQDLPDLFVMEGLTWCFDCDEDTMELYTMVGNQGLADAPATSISFVAGGVALTSVAIDPLPAGAQVVIGPVIIDTTAWTTGALDVVVDAAGDIDECDEDNNSSSSMGVIWDNECN